MKKKILGFFAVLLACMIFATGCGSSGKQEFVDNTLFKQGLLSIEDERGLYGFVNAEGEYVIEPKFDSVNDFSSNGLAVVRVDDVYGYINVKGEYVIEPRFKMALPFDDNGLAQIQTEKGYGYIDSNGEYIVEPIYYSVSGFDENGIAIIGREYYQSYEPYTEQVDPIEYTYVDSEGNLLFDRWFDKATAFNESGLAVVGVKYKYEKYITPYHYSYVYGYKYGCIDIEGNYVISPQYKEISKFTTNGLASVCIDGSDEFSYSDVDLYGYVNSRGEEVIPCDSMMYSHTSDFADNGLAMVKPLNGGKCGYIYSDGSLAIEAKYDSASAFTSNGIALVGIKSENGNYKYGYINEKGGYIIEPQFDDATSFSDDGLARVLVDGKCGYINKNGKYIIQPKFDNAFEFSDNGLAIVVVNGKYGCVNKKGEYVVEPQYDEAFSFTDNGLAKVKCDGKYGYINESGKTIIEPKYDVAFDFSDDGYTIVGIKDIYTNTSKYDIINTKGKVIIDNYENSFKLVTLMINQTFYKDMLYSNLAGMSQPNN